MKTRINYLFFIFLTLFSACGSDDSNNDDPDTNSIDAGDAGNSHTDVNNPQNFDATNDSSDLNISDLANSDDTNDTDIDANPPQDAGISVWQMEAKLSIKFDYRFDTKGFFSDPVRKAILEKAAHVWAVYLLDDFAEIKANTWIYVRNPENTSKSEQFKIETAIDDILIFVGGQEMADRNASSSATAAIPKEADDPQLYAELTERWEGSDFEPWTGWISFNNVETDWFFDSTIETDNDIPSDGLDFFSVAVHEIGHILGFAPGGAYGALIDDGYFIGVNATAIYGDKIPLEDGYGHIADGVTYNGEIPVMCVNKPRGRRYLPTKLELAMLEDIGYEIQ